MTAGMGMNAFFGYFQLAALAVFILIFLGRSVYLRFGLACRGASALTRRRRAVW